MASQLLGKQQNVMQGSRPETPGRVELSDRLLLGLVILAVVVLAGYFSLLPFLPPAWRTPGSTPLYLLGISGAVLLLVSMGFVAVKRSGRGGAAPTWFAAHVLSAIIGMALVAVHSGGSFVRPPALLFLALLALSVIGVWARTRVSRQMSATFATRHGNFGPADASAQSVLRGIIGRKTALLERLEPAAAEGQFSLAPAHWLRHPLLALGYRRLEVRESRLIGHRRALPMVQAYWRRLHILLGYIFVLGLAGHILTVTFLAEYAADGREIIWPHINLW